MSDGVLYLHCKECVKLGLHASIRAVVFEGDLMILCGHGHGMVHVQPYAGRQLDGCEHETHRNIPFDWYADPRADQ